MEIQRIEPHGDRWDHYVAHLKRVDNACWVLEGDDERPLADVLFLGVVVGAEVVGDLALRKQVVSAPATEWSGGVARPLLGEDERPMEETFVMTFFVEEAHRRKGYGRALQEAALALTREAGCFQMRSWSSLDKPENHRLKLSLGFALHPEVHRAASGYDVTGAYFVKRVD